MSAPLQPLESDLLLAAFLPHPDAPPAWERWRDSIDWDRHIDPEAFTLLPTAHRNLRGLGVDDKLFPRFKGIARHAWLVNQRRFAEVKDSLDECAHHGVELLWLPPVWRWLADPAAVLGHRHGLQWAVRPEQSAAAIQCLLRVGWRPSQVRLPENQIPGYVLGAKHLVLKSPKGEAAMLTWGLEWWFGQRTPEVWRRAIPLVFGKQPTLGLDRTDALEFALRQASPDSALGGLADVLSIAAEPAAIDWQRLDNDLRRQPLPVERAAVLPLLKPFLDGWAVPVEAAHWCGERQPDPAPVAAPAPPLARCRQDWRRYCRAWGAQYRPATALLQLPGYLMGRWRLADPRQLLTGLAGWLGFKRRGQNQ
ncbi:hypothetical protein [Methylomagnum sp.]